MFQLTFGCCCCWKWECKSDAVVNAVVVGDAAAINCVGNCSETGFIE